MTAADDTGGAKPEWSVRLWDAVTDELLWSGRLPDGTAALDEFLAERGEWTMATVDDDSTGQCVWAGRLTLDKAGLVESRPELEFLAPFITGRNPALPAR